MSSFFGVDLKSLIVTSLGLEKKIDIIQGTFAKAFGVIGGYISASEEIIDTIYQNKIPKPGSYTGRINAEPVDNRKTLLGNKNA